MKQDEKIVVILALGGVAWYLYTRQNGLTLTGQPEHPMIPANRNLQSLITPSYATGVQATNTNNPVAAIGSLVNQALSIFTKPKAPGNGPVHTAAPSISIPSTGAPASSPGVLSIGSQVLTIDPTLADENPFFGWGWDVPLSPADNAAGISSLSWTVTPDMAAIPPPPGV
jgi:hypothetical protein